MIQLPSNLAEELHIGLYRRKMSLRDLADESGIKVWTLSRVTTGRRPKAWMMKEVLMAAMPYLPKDMQREIERQLNPPSKKTRGSKS